jgi:flagellar assembly protein FliH
MTAPEKPELISGEGLGDDLLTWEAPQVTTPKTGQPTPETELEALRRQAREQGYAEGRATGLADAQIEIDRLRDSLMVTLDALARPFDELEYEVEKQLIALVRAVSRQLVRRELKSAPGEVVGPIRAALDALPVGSREVVVRLHPEDAQLVSALLKTEGAMTPWSIQADPLLERGGCEVISETSEVDGRLETRLGRVIANMFEDQRDDSSDEPRSDYEPA